MNAVVFETQVKNNVIEIPRQFHQQIPESVLVTIIGTAPESMRTTPHIIPRAGTGIKTLRKPHIDTTGWTFNRDEANER